MTTDTLLSGAPGLQPRPVVRRGPRHWLASFAAMLRFDVLAQRTWLPMFVLMQVLFGTGMAVIYGFWIGSMPSEAALYLVTGAPAIAVITSGLVFVPSMVSDRKLAGT